MSEATDSADLLAGALGSSREFRRILDAIPAMVALIGADRRYTFANSFYLEKHGLTLEELVQRSVEDNTGSLYTELEPELDAAFNGQRRILDVEYVDASGEKRWVNVHFEPDRSAGGSTRAVIAFIQDAHARRMSEELSGRFRLAFDQGMEGLALHDSDGDFVYVNPAQARAYGYEADELIGKSWRCLYAPEEAQRIDELYFPVLMRNGSWRGELTGRRKSGDEFPIEVSLTMLIDDDGQPAGLACSCRDITERKFAEASLRQLHKIEALGQLTGGVAHDFNNLLAVILGNLEILQGMDDHEGARQPYLTAAISAVESGAALTQQLLSYCRKQPLRPRPFELPGFLEELRTLLARSLGESIHVDIDCADCTWPCLADASQLENAILNLALNARDAMPDGGTISISAKHAPETVLDGRTEDCLRITVSDHGSGIHPKDRERVFDPFFTTKSTDKGTGLGLSMVHGFVLQSGGQIAIESSLGQGTSVHMYLPRSREVVPARRTAETPRGRGETILVIEDHRDVLTLCAELLDGLGYSVLAAENGATAIEIAKRERLDMILSDVRLPGDDGPLIVAAIRELQPDVPALLMSGNPPTLTNSPDLRLLPKPFSGSDLALLVRETLDSACESP